MAQFLMDFAGRIFPHFKKISNQYLGGSTIRPTGRPFNEKKNNHGAYILRENIASSTPLKRPKIKIFWHIFPLNFNFREKNCANGYLNCF